MEHSTTRFSSRVDDYVKYRPSYPREIIDLFRSEAALDASSTIADIGSGTGMLTQLFIGNCDRVFAVEPNKEMREAAETLHRNDASFKSVAASAEQTTIDGNSVDLIVAGQAFHWFDMDKSKSEFRRILRPGGWIALIWNQRRIDNTPFLKNYETILRKHSTEYALVKHRNIGRDRIEEFFSPETVNFETFQNIQKFDYEGLVGRCLSSSHSPSKGSDGHEQMIADLQTAFERHQCNGIVEFEYDTEIFYGQIENAASQPAP